MKVVLGNPDQWTIANIKDLGQTVVALLPSDLQKISNATLFKSLKYLKEIEVHVDQVNCLKKNKIVYDYNKVYFLNYVLFLYYVLAFETKPSIIEVIMNYERSFPLS